MVWTLGVSVVLVVTRATIPEVIILVILMLIGLAEVVRRGLILRKLVRKSRGVGGAHVQASDSQSQAPRPPEESGELIYPFTSEWLRGTAPGAITTIVAIVVVGLVGTVGIAIEGRPDYLFIWIPICAVMAGIAVVNLVSLREEDRRKGAPSITDRSGTSGKVGRK
ncbi:hypothetical protein [Microbacterium dauci]|uniref:Uncharacterized protein n=1 Tax=Microbacterium dauci TaxID=3048008 RepID=A0ABT6ZCC0_9MICO|nr:hypothetical protein [Microbacterium sp. LX3-4]MDJ1113802.1 hypothetical protein [Microbacterium sp. LX3-4]